MIYVYNYYLVYYCLNYLRKVNSGDYFVCVCVFLYGIERFIILGKF